MGNFFSVSNWNDVPNIDLEDDGETHTELSQSSKNKVKNVSPNKDLKNGKIETPLGESDHGSDAESDKGSVTDSDKGSVTDSDKGSVTDSDKGSVTESDKGSVTDSDKGSVTDSDKASNIKKNSQNKNDSPRKHTNTKHNEKERDLNQQRNNYAVPASNHSLIKNNYRCHHNHSTSSLSSLWNI